MTALSDAAQAVADAREAAFREKTLPSLDRLIRAVRHHDAEVVRALGPETMVGQYARDTIAARLDSPSTVDTASEVKVRYAGGPTIQIAGHSVKTDAETGLVVVEGFITSRTGQPLSGDAVSLAYVGIPGRGALVDITASVELFTRLTVLNIRIRTTIRAEETP